MEGVTIYNFSQGLRVDYQIIEFGSVTAANFSSLHVNVVHNSLGVTLFKHIIFFSSKYLHF